MLGIGENSTAWDSADENHEIAVSSIFKATSHGITLILTVLGNVLVCYFGMSSTRKSAMNNFVVNLAFGEILLALVSTPPLIEKEMFTRYLLIGEMACKLLEYFLAVSMGSVSTTLIILAADRYYSTLDPLSKITRRQAKYLIIFSWCFPMVTLSPVFFYFFGVSRHPPGVILKCVPQDFTLHWMDKLYSVTQLLILFVVPMVLTSFVYVYISRRLTLSERRHFKTELNKNYKVAKMNSNFFPRSKRRALIMNMVVLIMYILFWSPLVFLHCLCLAIRINGHLKSLLYEICTFVALAKLTLNPFIYSYFDSVFRERILCCAKAETSRHVVHSDSCLSDRLTDVIENKAKTVEVNEQENKMSTKCQAKTNNGGKICNKRHILLQLICNTRKFRPHALSSSETAES